MGIFPLILSFMLISFDYMTSQNIFEVDLKVRGPHISAQEATTLLDRALWLVDLSF